MRFIRHHWFGMITGLIIFAFFSLFILILLSPRQDMLRRGFIPCTEEFVEEIVICKKNKVWCLLKSSAKNSWCDFKVVGYGIAKWVKGEQNYPWSNYIFIPQLPEDEDFNEEARAEYLKNNANFSIEMEELKKINKELEDESNQQEPKSEDKPQ
ncbi:MAG: hypothetical protein E7019_03400 [Alphaproteobacteria bacterium]|nr:hypothetical protein [Alphaproteobacteria bacterium]